MFVLMKVQTASASGLPEESITSAPEAASRTLKMTQFRGFRIRYTSPKVPLSSSPRSVDKALPLGPRAEFIVVLLQANGPSPRRSRPSAAIMTISISLGSERSP